MAGVTRLELSGCSTAALHGPEPPAWQALVHLTSLRRLVLGGREQLHRRNDAAAAAAASEMALRHAAALGTLAALLPEGCQVQAEPPSVRLWWRACQVKSFACTPKFGWTSSRIN